jgi:predicted DNA-binding transcriptional regulator YafY
MRRADRLFRIVQHLRGRRLTTAAFLAERLEVSLRTIYRDVRDLSLSGVRSRASGSGRWGERGVGEGVASLP